MKQFIIASILLFSTIIVCGQKIYTKTFGNPKDKAVVFLHGGPGYNCVNFERTTAQKLADKGFFVIVYDRRGEGRSEDKKAKYTFDETLNDINYLLKKNKIKKAVFIGHSFGGLVATLFAEKYPDKTEAVVLVGAPVVFQETFRTIIKSSKEIYKQKNDTVNLKYITMLEKMDTSKLEYSSYCFAHARQNGFYSTKSPTDQAKSIYASYKTDSVIIKYGSRMNYQAAMGFWKNEKYTTIDLTSNIKKLLSQNLKIYGLYGKDDGLFSEEQVFNTQYLLGDNNLKYFDNCGHNVFIDQQTQFIETLVKWVK
jgi:proline iminopeptidase